MQAGVSPDAHVNCSGSMRLGNGTFHCWKRGGHGPIDMKRAIMQSCDIYFYQMVRDVGYDRIAPMARALGLGQRFDLPFSTQRYGTMPDSAWKRRKYKADWTVADSLNASIGQGYVLANPLQLAVMASRIASGKILHPRLLRDVPAAPIQSLGVAPDHLLLVHEAMNGVVNGGGTAGAARLNLPGIELSAKTGTAQVRRISMAERSHGVINNRALPFKLRDHALFICFGPSASPRYAAAVVLEHNGHLDRTLDGPLTARDVMTYLFDRNKALASLAEFEPGWGGDIKTRMVAEAAAYRQSAAMSMVAAAATETDATAPTDAPAVSNATSASDARIEALADGAGTGNTVAEDRTTTEIDQ